MEVQEELLELDKLIELLILLHVHLVLLPISRFVQCLNDHLEDSRIPDVLFLGDLDLCDVDVAGVLEDRAVYFLVLKKLRKLRKL